ncbi:hypothetical protein HPT25_28000 [Bacillus sp. BRMEA1]|uniref:hypothetical protein n=1 Tax=Neobacillus endophyticus TaxID=2738405 RepID=UPI0015642CDF|nr:hypothetical protein [Neobacillus endophyticus]NRD81138.1 hypothetical protein [Neobacillus endophyticus]
MNTFNWFGMDLSFAIETVANKRLEELETSGQIQELPHCKEYRAKLSEFYQEFKEQLTDEHKKMLLEFDGLASDWSSAYGDSLFMQGFYEGMSFLRKMVENGVRKESDSAKVASF